MQISEIFHSIQGEGAEIGLPTTFVRTAECNLRCGWCDTEYAWEDGEEMSVKEVMEEVNEFRCSRLCITGGEPLLQEDLYDLIDPLIPRYEISVETNGSLDISELIERDLKISMDHKTPSSGMKEKMKEKNLGLLREKDQLKFVISDEEDYEYSKQILERYEISSEIVFQVEEDGDLRELVENVLNDQLDVRVLLQLHKIIWGDERKV